MSQLRRSGKSVLLAISIASALFAAPVFAQDSKDAQHARMGVLQSEFEGLKSQTSAAALALIQSNRTEFAQISASLGGDVPCATGVGPSGSSAPRAPAPAPVGCTPTTATFTQATPVAVPTGPAVVTSTVLVSGASTYLWDVDVTTFLLHTFPGDLDITITSPAGTVVTLTTDNAGTNDNVYNGTVWDDDANPGGLVPYVSNNGLVTDHVYVNLTLASPLVPEESLAAFVGENPNGTWTLTVSDDLAGDGGSIDSFSVAITTFPSAPILTVAPPFNQMTPVAIPTGPGVATSTLAVAGLSNAICKVALRTNMLHTWANDLDVALTSPTGTIVTLTTDNGNDNDNVFGGTLWDDDANPLGQVPYVTNNGLVTDNLYANLTAATPLVVEESMGAFMGETANGTWTITISDDLAGDGGSLDSWGLDFTTCTCASADLAVTLTDTPDPVNAGSNLTYTATALNNGPTGADNVSLAVTIPVGTTFVSATPSAGGLCTGTTTVTCTWAGSTAVAASVNASIVVSVPASTLAGTVLAATAVGSSTTTDPTPANNTANASTTVGASADLTITLTDAPDPVTAGTNLTYTATINNGGPSNAQAVSLSLPLPAGTTFVSATPSAGGMCNAASPVVCSWAGATAPATARTATIVVAVAPATTGSLSATATASSTTTDPTLGNNTATATTTVSTSANLSLALSASSNAVAVNVPVTFTATSTNLGPSVATNVVVAITLSPDFRFSSFTASAGAVCTAPQIGNSGVISCTWAGPTAPMATRTLAVNAFSNSPGTSSIQATTSSATTDPVTANNTLSVSVTVGAEFEPIPAMDLRGLALLTLLLSLVGFVMIRRQA